MTYTGTDMFCGAGGSSIGAEAAGMTLMMAANHWKTAIDVHQQHFPDAAHDCADISQADPRRYPVTDILLASPECFTAGHLVTTRDGQVPIESVKVGDVVLTHLGRWRPVVRIQKRRGSTVIVKGQGHTGIETTSTHRFWSKGSIRIWDNAIRDYRRQYSEPWWIEADQLLDNEACWATPTTAELLPESQPPHIFGTTVSTAWWFVGRWVGDGSLTFGRNHEVLLTCGFHETDLLRDRLRATGVKWAESTKRTATVFSIGDFDARDWLHSLFGHGAGDKGLPSFTLTMPAKHREALLDGYLSADGGATQRRIRASTISRKLAVSVRLLAESLGHRVAMAHDHRSTYSIEGRTGVAQLQWIIHWEPQLTPRRSPEAFDDGHHAWSRVRSVGPGRSDVMVYNIEVEEDHSYVLDGIVVANCTNHSQARGISRKQQDPTLWDAPDPDAERSRATMWDVVRFAEQIHYTAIVVENVVEATKWILFPAWYKALEDLGYSATILSHNSMHHKVPQSRDRIYIVWTRNGLKVDLERELDAWCGRCERVGPSRQAWKTGRTVGRYNSQWIWSCTTCHRRVEPATEAAATIIDWQLDCPRIGDRTKSLAPNTRARILAGLQRYGWAPITTSGAGNGFERAPGNRARPVTDPVATQTCTGGSALATPPGFAINTAHGGRLHDLAEPHPTVCASDDRLSLVMANNTNNVARPVTDPLATATTGNRHALVVPLRRNGHASTVEDVAPTVTAGGNHHGLLMRNYGNTGGDPGRHVTPTSEPARTMTTEPGQALLMRNNGTTAGESWAVTPVSEPARSMTTKGHQSLLVPEPSLDDTVDDCGFRMLEPYEVAAAMAFPVGYIPRDLPKKHQVKLAGNAVTPPVMQWIVGRIIQAMERAA